MTGRDGIGLPEKGDRGAGGAGGRVAAVCGASRVTVVGTRGCDAVCRCWEKRWGRARAGGCGGSPGEIAFASEKGAWKSS